MKILKTKKEKGRDSLFFLSFEIFIRLWYPGYALVCDCRNVHLLLIICNFYDLLTLEISRTDGDSNSCNQFKQRYECEGEKYCNKKSKKTHKTEIERSARLGFYVIKKVCRSTYFTEPWHGAFLGLDVLTFPSSVEMLVGYEVPPFD